MVLPGLVFQGVHFVRVFHGRQVVVPEHGVVIQVELGVQGQHGPGLGDHQGVDLRQGAVQADEHAVEILDEARGRADQGGVEPDPEGQVPGLVGGKARRRVHRLFKYPFRGPGRHFLDLHAAFGAHHDHRLSRTPVHHQPQVELLGDILGLLHQDLVDHLAFRAGLGRDQRHAQDLVGHLLHFLQGGGNLDAPAFAPASGVDLGLDHKRAFGQGFRHLPGFPGGRSHVALGHRHVKLFQQIFGLIFVNFHGRSFFRFFRKAGYH